MTQDQSRPKHQPLEPDPSKSLVARLSVKGSARAGVLEEILSGRGFTLSDLFQNFEKEELIKILDDCEVVVFDDKKNARAFEVYREVPAILVLEGMVHVSYLDLEGDRQRLDVLQADKPRLFEAGRSLITCSVKQSDLNLLTGFRIENIQLDNGAVALFLNSLALEEALQTRQQLQVQKIIRQRQTLRHYGLDIETPYTPLPISKTMWVQNNEYVLLLRGKLCIMKDTLLLSCYNQGLFSQLTNKKLGTRFVLLVGSEVVFCDDVWKNQKYQEGETRRLKHLETIIAKYATLSDKQVRALQKQFITVNELNPNELQQYLPKKKQKRQTLKQQVSLGPKLVKKNSLNLKEDLKSTKTSIEKCTIRIRVKKK